MSHSKGLLAGTCLGNFTNYRKPVDGVQTQKCGRCSKLRTRTVRPCFLFHDYTARGKAKHGVQKEKCRRCGRERTGFARTCGWLKHSWHTCSDETRPGIHCAICLKPRKGYS